MAKARQQKTVIKVKTALLERNWSVADLARNLTPNRPRTTVSQAIHHDRFPKVWAQIEEALSL